MTDPCLSLALKGRKKKEGGAVLGLLFQTSTKEKERVGKHTGSRKNLRLDFSIQQRIYFDLNKNQEA